MSAHGNSPDLKPRSSAQLREIRDADGQVWQVFDVHPAREVEGAALTEAHMRGWLCFLSPKGRRRIAPIPYGWVDLADNALRHLLSVAPLTGTRPRPTDE